MMPCQESSALLNPLEVYDLNMKRSIRVEVVEPVTITSRESLFRSTSFTSYHILIETDHWAFTLPFSNVRRRYSEFCWLRAKLQSHHPNKPLPPLPPKRLFHMTKFDTKYIEERRYGLGKFIQRVMRSSELLSDAALHLFLQSDMSIAEIDEKLAESIKPGLRKTESRLTPYLLRSLSSGSTGSAGSSEVDFNGDENEQTVDQQNDIAQAADLQEINKVQRKRSLRKEPSIILNEMVSLVITHEDTAEVVEVANSPTEAPILSSLCFQLPRGQAIPVN